MKKFTQFLMLCAFGLCVACPGVAKAQGVTLTLTPVISGTIGGIGSTTDYNLNISGLHTNPDIAGSPALGGYNVVLDFNPTIVSFTSVLYGSAVNDFAYTDSSVSGQLTLSNQSFSSAATLEGSQAASFTVATVTFQGTALGSSAITIDPTTSLSDENGSSLAVVVANNSSVQVVPEPSVFGFASLGLLAVLMFQRRRLYMLA